jgi:ribokinase
MNPKIVVVGSVNIDLVLQCPHLPRPGETLTGSELRTLPGGKGANQAVAATRLGGAVALIGCVGADVFGSSALATLRDESVNLVHLNVMPDTTTGVAIVLVDDAGENCIALSPGANYSLSKAHVDAAAPLIEGASLLVCQLEVPIAAVQRAVETARAAGVPVLLNPAPAQPLPADLLRLVDWLVLNEGEAALLSGLRVENVEDAASAAALLRARGCRTVLVTLGADGVLAADAAGSVHHRAMRVRAVDTTGAGDTFVGALAVALCEGADLGQAVALAQRAAAFSVERHGAQPSMPCRSDLLSAGTGPSDHQPGAPHVPPGDRTC